MTSEYNNTSIDEMEEFLRGKGLTNEQLLRMREQKIEPAIILLMDDMQLAEFVPKFGHRIALRQFCKLKSHTECPISSRKQSLLEKLRQKLNNEGNSNEDGNRGNKPKKFKACSQAQDYKQIELGWLCCLDEGEDKYRQVREISGGGTRKIKVPKSADKYYIIEKGINLFFPNGKSTKGQLDEFTVDLFDFKSHEIEAAVTVAEMLDATGLSKLRFYLATKKKAQKEKYDSEDLTPDNSQNDQDSVALTMEPDNENVIVYSINNKSYNDLSLESSNSQELYNTEETLCNFVNPNVETSYMNKRDINTFNQDEVNMLLNHILDESGNTVVDNLEVPDLLKQSEDKDQSPWTLVDILGKLQHKIEQDNINKFNVFRTDIFNCCIRAMRRKAFRPFYKLSVKFSDCEGITEGAIDEGGPTRELFRLVLNFIQDSQLFTGTTKKHISLHNNSLKEKLYYEAGRLISLSLVHGGPGPHFFSETLFYMLTTGVQNTMPTLDDVDIEIQNKLIALKGSEDLLELQEIVTSENIFSIAGCQYIKHVDEKWKILDDTLKFYALKRVEEPLEQLMEGLQTCGIYEQMKAYPHLFRDVFCSNKIIVTGDVLEKIFEVEYSEAGSNKRELENRAISYFRDYVMDCEENSTETDVNKNYENAENTIVTVADILVFATGADSVPPLGFPVKPKIIFLHEENKSKFPIANTCALQLKLPTLHMHYDNFKANMDFGIGNAKAFGFA